MQSRVVVDGVVDGVGVEVGLVEVGGTEVDIVLNTAVVVGIVVVGHGLDCISVLHDALQYLT